YLANGVKNSRKKSAIAQKTLIKKTFPVNNQDHSSNDEVKNLNVTFPAEKDGEKHLTVNNILEIPSSTLSKSALSDTTCISDLSNDLALKRDRSHCFKYYSTYDKLLNMRRRLSRVLVVDFLFCIYEFYNLVKFLIPWTYGIFLPSCFGSFIVKATVVYFIFYKGFRKSLFFMDSIFVVKRAVGVELMFIMSFIGILYAMYDTSISRK
ncbi:hypothetical protein PCK2_000369, partial [Pneumocystis canis]